MCVSAVMYMRILHRILMTVITVYEYELHLKRIIFGDISENLLL